ncbi:hypothetical protein V6N11_055596 [Hibiscus sabdariffa]|uniref:RRM domain-containing protein n=1 Tax=Hibiscus sabdariffa TaxID=183260 RepID=A0ABR2NR18_9ROSI
MGDRRGRSVHGLSGSNCFSVYVGNLSPKVNWRYLKKLFERFGSVLDVFIPQKKDLFGSNFGFVRFPTIREAETAVLMFGGAWVVDRRINVNIEKFNSRTSFWRKKRSSRNDSWAVDTQNNENISGDPAANKVEKGECSQAETYEGKRESEKVSECTESSSEKSPDFHRSCSIEMKDDHVGWDSAFNADCLGKGLHHSSEINRRRGGSFVGEMEQKGGEEVFKH